MLVAAATLVATYKLGCRVAGRKVAAWAAALLAVSPLFFAQSSMLHIEVAPALFITLAVLALLPRAEFSTRDHRAKRMAAFALAASLAILSKETSVILLPVAWAYAWRARRELPSTASNDPRAWLALGFPLVPIIAWAIYYHHATGFWTGNAEYLRYNLYSTLTPARFLLTLARRLYQLLIAGFNWILVVGAILGVWWERRERARSGRPSLPSAAAHAATFRPATRRPSAYVATSVAAATSIIASRAPHGDSPSTRQAAPTNAGTSGVCPSF